MTSKKKNPYKILTALGLLIIAVVIFAFSSSREIESAPIHTNPVDEVVQLDSSEIGLSVRDSIELFGKEFLGVPYIYGGTSKKGFDCSGFVYYVFNQFDISVPRTSSQFGKFGKEVSIDSVKKGDILVFLSPTRNAIGHIGIVTDPKGMETEFIHASSGKEMQVMISSLKQPNYNRRFVKAISVLEE